MNAPCVSGAAQSAAGRRRTRSAASTETPKRSPATSPPAVLAAKIERSFAAIVDRVEKYVDEAVALGKIPREDRERWKAYVSDDPALVVKTLRELPENLRRASETAAAELWEREGDAWMKTFGIEEVS